MFDLKKFSLSLGITYLHQHHSYCQKDADIGPYQVFEIGRRFNKGSSPSFFRIGFVVWT